MVSVPARRQQVAYGRERGLSARRACTLFSVARSALEYRSRKGAKDAPVVTRMKELSAQYPRYGYRRIRIFIARDGHRMSPGRAHRLWQTARLQVPRKRLRKRIAAAPRARPQTPSGPNQVWCYDFMFDHCANGQQLKCLTVADEFTKEGLAIEVDGRIRSARVIEVLSRLVSARGAPRFLRSDNGPEFVSKALLSWIVAQGIGTALIEPGKPWQNGVAESFNMRATPGLRLNEHIEEEDGPLVFQHACKLGLPAWLQACDGVEDDVVELLRPRPVERHARRDQPAAHAPPVPVTSPDPGDRRAVLVALHNYLA